MAKFDLSTIQSKMIHASKRLLITFGKIGLALIACMVLYIIYLDGKVTAKFEGQKWQLPAQIYARPLALYPQQSLTKQQLINELELLKYRKVKKLTRAGQYTVSRHHVSFVRRAFQFAEGFEGEKRYSIEFKNDKIVRVSARGEQENISFARIEPLLIDRLQSPNKEDRELIHLEDIPEVIKDTLLLIEDKDFYHHAGVSPLAIMRALFVNLQAGRTVQGGSTLTQQLAKNLYLTREKKLWRKVNEAFIALILDYRFSKDQLLAAYFNEVYMGQYHNQAVHGFGLASRYYFSKPLNELQPHEYALLVAIVKGPSFYDPRRFPERARKRRDLVLRQMLDADYISVEEYKVLVDMPLNVTKKSAFKTVKHPAYIDKVKRELRAMPELDSVIDNGIKVFTALNPLLQQQMERTASQGIEALQQAASSKTELQTAMISIDIEKAGVAALVGDKNVEYSGFNRVLDSKRNIGSLVKPAIYLAALSQPEQYYLGSVLADEKITVEHSDGDMWQPQNANKRYVENIQLIDALVTSQNVPTVWLGNQLGVATIKHTLQQLGVTSRIPDYPSMMLGAISLSPIEVAQMYHTIANNGAYQQISAVLSVTDSRGSKLWDKALSYQPRFNFSTMYLLNYALHRVTTKGTAKALGQAIPRTAFAGKTGTTNQKRDSWFSGFDQNILTVTWVGNDDNKSVALTGAKGALQQFIHLHKQTVKSSYLVPKPADVEMAYVGQLMPINKANVNSAAKSSITYSANMDCKRTRILPIHTNSKEIATRCNKKKN
ncbi:penicillin-binding protein 1B [Flocculibacter collagenilyticus]|uniref:penicillin-binding protein 1B n=1 Tax=Flocculibacter collagenilyticus TaxID=2744479 RepID=UPI0018F4674B|nr:penicillin-binding protein 1B [Flocculibacter collagenilyticus]